MFDTKIVIFPYHHEDYWVFDYEPIGLIKEPFVSGIPAIIDALVGDIPNADKGFKFLFSPCLFQSIRQN